jgi:transglutaminase-like putative cysteine protease
MTLIRIARVSLVCAALLTLLDATRREPRTRSFHFEYDATVKDIPAGARHVDLWLTIPHDDSYQQIRNLRIESPFPYRIAAAPDGNRILHVGIDSPDRRTFTVRATLDATRREHIQANLTGGAPPAAPEDSKTLDQYLKPDRLVPIDGQIRAWAREVVDKAGAHTPLEMARAIYNHVVATVKYDKTGKGWGRGDIYYACEARRGNCTDFHAIVIGYARALGIPARFAIGFPLPAGRGEGKIAGYHCWAELYVAGTGWVPIDASEAAKNPARREYFFGAHDENRIEFSKGRDIVLVPRQKGEPLNYFVYPYAEVDGVPFAGAVSEVSYRDETP